MLKKSEVSKDLLWDELRTCRDERASLIRDKEALQGEVEKLRFEVSKLEDDLRRFDHWERMGSGYKFEQEVEGGIAEELCRRLLGHLEENPIKLEGLAKVVSDAIEGCKGG